MLLALIAAGMLDGASASPSPTIVPVILAAGTYSYAIRQGSTTLGNAIISVQRADGSVKTHEIATLMGRSFTVDQTLDATTFQPKTLDAVYPGAKPTAIHVKFGEKTIDETVAGMGSKSLDMPAGAKGIAALDGPVMSGFFIMPAQARAIGSTSFAGISPGSASMMSLKLDAADKNTRPSGVPVNDDGYTVTGLQSGDVTIWFDPGTLLPRDFEIPTQGISIARISPLEAAVSAAMSAVPKPLPTATPHFTSRDLTFTSSDGTRLAGTLTVPDRRTSRLPAVVLVHGSGPATRDENIGPNPIFLQLSNALSNHGYVVLRYDKRGVGKSGGNPRTVTRDRLLADARAAIAAVAARVEVDPHAVFVLGHSEGGELAPSLAAQGAPLHGIALMAPPAIPLDQILLQQVARGLHGDAARRAVTAQESANTAIRTGLANSSAAIWLRSSFDVDPANVIKHVPCPILVLQGGKDFQVLPKDLPRLVNAARSAHRDITVRIFPNDDHLFITVPTGQKATLAEYMVPHRVDPAMISALVTWLRAHQ